MGESGNRANWHKIEIHQHFQINSSPSELIFGAIISLSQNVNHCFPMPHVNRPGQQKSMTFRQLEDTISKWTPELVEQERSFLDQATQVT